jgi:hypothetical protein
MKRISIAFAIVLTAISPIWAGASLAAPPALRQVEHAGKQYYATYRVVSARRATAYQKSSVSNAWQVGGPNYQYGQGFYLFGKLSDAKRFVGLSRSGQAHQLVHTSKARLYNRSTIVEVLIPKATYDSASKGEVTPEMDWAIGGQANHPHKQDLRRLRSANDLLYGKWIGDSSFPEPAFNRMNGTEQIAITSGAKMNQLLGNAVVRVVPPTTARELRSKAMRKRVDPLRAAFLEDRQASLAQAKDAGRQLKSAAETIRTLDSENPSWGAIVNRLKARMPSLRRFYPRSMGTWEGFKVEEHTRRAFNILKEQERHYDLVNMGERYGLRLRAVIRIALAMHDVGKPLSYDILLGALDRANVEGKPFAEAGKNAFIPHESLSIGALNRMMESLGFSTKEIALAKALVGNHAIGHMVQDKLSQSRAAQQLIDSAAATGIDVKDYFALQSLFYAADAGSYPKLRQMFSQGDSAGGRLRPSYFKFDMLADRLAKE